MSIVKTITTEHYNRMPYCELTVTETATSTVNNTSTLSYSVVLKRPSSYTPTATKTATCTINGTTYTWSGKLTGSGTSDMTLITGTTTVTHNTDGSKSIDLKVSFTLNTSWDHVSYGTLYGSGTMALSNIPRYATVTQSISGKTETQFTIAWSADSTIDHIWYSWNNSLWNDLGAVNATSGTFTITGRTPNATYTLYVRYRRKDSQLETDSPAITIQMYNYPYCTSMPNFTIGSSVSLGFYNPLGREFTFYIIGNGTQITNSWTIKGTAYSGLNASSTQTQLYATIPNNKSATYQVKCVYGSSTITKTGGTYTCNESVCKPSIGVVTYYDSNSSVTAITGDNQKIVQNKSTPYISARELSAKNSASISNVKVAINGTDYTMTVSGTNATKQCGVVNSGSSVDAVCTITDSRGYTNTKSITLDMVGYSNPSAIIDAWRTNNYYDSSHIVVDADYISVGSNSCSISFQYKQSGTSTWSSAVTLQDNTQYDFTANNQYAWDLKVVLVDSFGSTTTINLLLQRGLPLMFFDKARNSIGFNRIPNGDMVADIYNMYQATGASNSATSVSADTITQIPLVSTGAISVGSGFSVSNDGGIKVDHAGIYRITGSAYLTGGISSGVNRKDVFLYCGASYATATEVSNVTDNVGTTSVQQHGSVGTTAKLVSASANDVFYIACRFRGGSGSYYAGNIGTWLLVERIQ